MRVVLGLLLLLSPALAQPAAAPTEHVIVTGTKSQKVLEDFVQAFAAPTRMTGKLARWEDGVCPISVGLKPLYANFISQRVLNVAAQVGARANTRSGCRPNIEIVFTTTPQALLDNIRKKQDAFLGYADNDAQRDALAKVTRPIQAWYLTASRDLRGNIIVDSAKALPTEITLPDPFHNPPFITIRTKQGAVSVTGGRLGDGMRSSLYHVIIVADPIKLLDHDIGELADYISLLALSQVSGLDACQSLPSIVNMLAPGCERETHALSVSDMGYLRGLYRMDPGGNLRGQKDAVVYQMQQAQDGN